MKKQMFVAEIKTTSPYGFKSGYTFNQLLDVAITYGDAVSVHVDALWGGSHWLLNETRNEVLRRQGKRHMPILAKGLHLTDASIEKSLYEFGATKCLVVGRIPAKKYLQHCWLEPITNNQANEMAKAGPDAIVVNRRHLQTGQDLGYGPFIPTLESRKKGLKIIQASMIKKPENVQKWADGFIVGEHLPAFVVSKVVDSLVPEEND